MSKRSSEQVTPNDARELCLEMANQIEASALGCIDIGAIERGKRMLKWAAELREEAIVVDADGYYPGEGHA